MDKKNEMNPKIKLRANLCSCGAVWFTEDLPESDPSRCPFCGITIQELDEDDERREEAIENTKNAGRDFSKEKLNLQTKICKFCSNQIFILDEDVDKAENCPYCEHELITSEEFQNILSEYMDYIGANDQAIIDNNVEKYPASIASLIGQNVTINFMSDDLEVETEYVFLDFDIMTGFIKLGRVEDEKTIWKPFSEIRTITECND